MQLRRYGDLFNPADAAVASTRQLHSLQPLPLLQEETQNIFTSGAAQFTNLVNTLLFGVYFLPLLQSYAGF